MNGGSVKMGSVKGGVMKEPRCHEGTPLSRQQAGGTNPTGMLSCFWCSLHLKINFNL